MKRFSELAGLVAGLVLFVGTLVAVQAYFAHHGHDHRAGLMEPE